MHTTQTLVEPVLGAASTSTAFTRVQGDQETAETSTVSYTNTKDPADITSVPPNPWAPKYVLTLGESSNILHVWAQLTL